MCFQGNSARLSSTYIQAQLSALWTTGKQCADDTHKNQPSLDRDARERSEFTRALYEYASGTDFFHDKTSSFSFTFAEPKLVFLCNREALLTLTLDSGTIAPGTTTAGGEQPGQKLPAGWTARFRVPFERTDVKGHDSKIGNSTSVHFIRMIVFAFKDATPVQLGPAHAAAAASDVDLSPYFTDYLSFLQKSGHHVFFDLSEFATREKVLTTDYALIHSPIDINTYSEGVTISGYSTTLINTYLEAQYHGAGGFARQKGDRLAISIAEFSTEWLTGYTSQFYGYVLFGAPTIKMLCSHEVILIFDVKQVAIFNSPTFNESEPPVEHNWKIAFAVNVSEHNSNGDVVELDFSTARYAVHFSSGTPSGDTASAKHYTWLVGLLGAEYLDILVAYSYHIIYRRPGNAVVGSSVDDTGYWKRVTGPTPIPHAKRRLGQALIWIERIRDISLSRYDQVLTISEDSINRIFRMHGKKGGSNHLLSTWSDKSFEVHFEPLQIRLLSSRKVIVYVNCERGLWLGPEIPQTSSPIATANHQTTTMFWKRGDELLLYSSDTITADIRPQTNEFGKLTLAFEVDLQLVDKPDLAPTVAQRLNSLTSNDIIHLIMDFASSQYISDLSYAPDIETGPEGTRQLEALKDFVRSYLLEIGRQGYGILQSIPVFSHNTGNPFVLRDIDFTVLSKNELTVDHYMSGAQLTPDSPIIFIYGVSDDLPGDLFAGEWSLGWLPTRVDVIGSICFSKKNFLEGWLVSALDDLNAHTTFLPRFNATGALSCSLVSWYDDSEALRASGKKVTSCAWQPETKNSPLSLRYVWAHQYDWTTESDVTPRIDRAGEYTLAIHTKNTLTIPTERKSGDQVEVTLEGVSTIEVNVHVHERRRRWKSVVEWDTKIVFAAGKNGLQLSVGDGPRVRFPPKDDSTRVRLANGDDDSAVLNDFPFDLRALHEHGSRLAEGLKKAQQLADWQQLPDHLGKAWEGVRPARAFLANPVFTRHGDFMVEVCLADDDVDSLLEPAPLQATTRPGANPTSNPPYTNGPTPTSTSAPSPINVAPKSRPSIRQNSLATLNSLGFQR